MKKRRLALFRGDRALWIIIAVLSVFSLLVVYSSTVSKAYVDADGDTSVFLIRQARYAILGFFVIILVHWIDFRVYARYARTMFWLSVMLVLVALFVGETRNDANRWIPVPFFGRFQPSEMLKITLMLLLAVRLGARQQVITRIPIIPKLNVFTWSRNPQKERDIFNKTTKYLVLPVFVACGAILPANLSTALLLFFVSMVVFFVGRVRLKEIVRLSTVSIVIVVVLIGGMKLAGVGRADTWVARVENFIEPLIGGEARVVTQKDADDDFQKNQAKIAIASGGVFGKGPGNSTQRSQLPHPYSDYAYAFIVEEYGVLGGVIVFMMYLWMFYRTGVIVRGARKPTQALAALGLSLVITVQAFANMAVSLGLVPVTGQPLPLISMGGSSVFFTCVALGIILGISRQNDEELAQEEAEARLRAQQEQEALQDVEASELEEEYEQENDQIENHYSARDENPDFEGEPLEDDDRYDYEDSIQNSEFNNNVYEDHHGSGFSRGTSSLAKSDRVDGRAAASAAAADDDDSPFSVVDRSVEHNEDRRGNSTNKHVNIDLYD